jgi:type I restriction enzyme S subunit
MSGDIAYNKMRAWQGAIAASDYQGIISPAYVVMRPAVKVSSRYAHFLFRSPLFAKEAERWSYGITSDMWSLRPEHFKMIYSALPPPEEQAAIVRFLDHANRKIDRFIRGKKKLIALLNEQKQAIIHQAVTKGLDPTVPMKDSGIPWLGEIPTHWEVRRLRSISKSVTSGSRGWSAYAADEGPLFIRIANLCRMSLDLRFHNTVRLQLPDTSETVRTRVQSGDILLSITAYIGSVAVIPDGFEEAYVSQHVARCALRDRSHNSKWVGYVLLSEIGQTHGKLCLYGGTKDGLSLDDVKNYPLLLPPRDEQDRIVDQIETNLKKLSAAITRTEREIALIQEYRTRLTADVVTGKLDVREAAFRLSEELETDLPDFGNGEEEGAGEVEDE